MRYAFILLLISKVVIQTKNTGMTLVLFSQVLNSSESAKGNNNCDEVLPQCQNNQQATTTASQCSTLKDKNISSIITGDEDADKVVSGF